MPGTIKPLVGFIDATFSRLVAHKYKCKPSHTYACTCIHPYYHWEHSRSVAGLKCWLCLLSQWPLSLKGCMWVRCCLSISHRLPVDRYYNALCRQRIHWLSYNHPIVSALRDISCSGKVSEWAENENQSPHLLHYSDVGNWVTISGGFEDPWRMNASMLRFDLWFTWFTVKSQSLYQLFISFACNQKIWLSWSCNGLGNIANTGHPLTLFYL